MQRTWRLEGIILKRFNNREKTTPFDRWEYTFIQFVVEITMKKKEPNRMRSLASTGLINKNDGLPVPRKVRSLV